MASKNKSPGRVASPAQTPTPVSPDAATALISASPNQQQEPQPPPPPPPPPPPLSSSSSSSPTLSDHSIYSRRRGGAGGGGVLTLATTPPPTTTTLAPTPDPNDYEKSVHASIQLTDGELDILKEQVRLLNGLPATRQPEVRRPRALRPPKKRPRHTLTSRRRAELQRRRIVLRCGGNLKEKFDEYERMTRSADSALTYRRLRQDAMAHTNEEMDLAHEHRELQNLRQLALRAKRNEALEYRDNRGSRLRFRCVRGQPIISSNFRDAYDDYAKPPFAVPRRVRAPRPHNLPKIDKSSQIWLVPVEDESEVPLHRQLRSPDPDDRRSRRQRARPPLRAGKRAPVAQPQPNEPGQRRRPPWNFAISCPPNIGYSA